MRAGLARGRPHVVRGLSRTVTLLHAVAVFPWFLLITIMAVVVGTVCAMESPSVADIRERLDEIGIRSVRSADGGVIVSGSDAFKNAILLAQVSEIGERVAAVIGLKRRDDSASVRILVSPNPDDVSSIRLTHSRSGGVWIHRVVFQDYSSCDTPAAVEAICAAFLALYIPHSDNQSSATFNVPHWLRKGVRQVLTDESRSQTLEDALQMWREGRLLSPVSILGKTSAPPAIGYDVACGAFLVWLADPATGKSTLLRLFADLAAGRAINRQWLRERLGVDGSPDEQWDRWMLSQRRIVRSLGELKRRHLDALRDSWLIQSGVDGVPASIELSIGADCLQLLAYRDREWFPEAVRRERYQLEMLAQGRPRRFRELVSAYVKVLDAMAAGKPATAVVGLAVAARKQWDRLRIAVKQAGGVLSAH